MYIFNFIINTISIYFFLSIIITQYYSIKRFYRVVKDVIKKNLIIVICGLLNLFLLLINTQIMYLVCGVLLVVFYLTNHPLKFKFTRRNILLYIISSIVSTILIPSIFISSLISITIGFIITYPIELLIKRRYFLLSRKKLNEISPLIIGITGSYGKTSFKYILKEIISTKYLVQIPKGNINTPNGISKFINNELNHNTEVLILELGIDEINGMDVFSKFLYLDIGVITSIGENHIANFKTLKTTFEEKMKIKKLIKKDGKLFVNGDSIYLSSISNKNIIKFSKNNIKNNPVTENGLKVIYKDKEIIIPLYGEYVYSYIDGIIKISEFLGINEECILLGLKNIKPLERRINVKKYKNGYFINDSYNINVNGVRESISLLKKFNGNNVVITGGITEQGKHFVSQNNKIKNILKNQNVIFIGDRNHPLVKDHNFLNLYITKTLSEAYTLVDKYQFDNILLLSKGEDIYLK